MRTALLFSFVVSILTWGGLASPAKPIHYSHNLKPFQLTEQIVCDHDDTSYFMATNGTFHFSQNPCQKNCPIYTNGTVFKIDGEGHAFLDVNVYGGQQVYVDSQDGSLRYTPAGSPTLPDGAIAVYFDRIPDGDRNGVYAFYLRYPAPNRREVYGWQAVPPKPLIGPMPRTYGGYRNGQIFVDTPAYNQTTRWYFEALVVPYEGPSPAVDSYA